MSTKLMTSLLVLFITGIVCFVVGNAQVEEVLEAKPIAIPSADSSTKKVVDSTKIIRDEFVAQKENLKDKVNLLQRQQKQIEITQKQIDSLTQPTFTSSIYCP